MMANVRLDVGMTRAKNHNFTSLNTEQRNNVTQAPSVGGGSTVTTHDLHFADNDQGISERHASSCEIISVHDVFR